MDSYLFLQSPIATMASEMEFSLLLQSLIVIMAVFLVARFIFHFFWARPKDKNTRDFARRACKYKHKSVQTTLSLVDHSTTKDSADDNKLEGHLPCLCRPHQGCCHEHISTRPPRALQSGHTLTPIHWVIPYHLAFEHLHCIRGRLGHKNKKAFVPELSCSGNATSAQGTIYYWSNEIYFYKGTFLQKQKISCHLYGTDKNLPEHFSGCPHHSLSVSKPVFGKRNGLFEVQACVTNNPPRCPSHPKLRWSNFQGNHAQMVVCTICHSDAECTLELDGSNFNVQYTCYRDLGPGTDPTHSKWLSMLTGQGCCHRPEHRLDLYARVWRTAQDLQRPDVHTVTHQTPHGIFDVSSSLY